LAAARTLLLPLLLLAMHLLEVADNLCCVLETEVRALRALELVLTTTTASVADAAAAASTRRRCRLLLLLLLKRFVLLHVHNQCNRVGKLPSAVRALLVAICCGSYCHCLWLLLPLLLLWWWWLPVWLLLSLLLLLLLLLPLWLTGGCSEPATAAAATATARRCSRFALGPRARCGGCGGSALLSAVVVPVYDARPTPAWHAAARQQQRGGGRARGVGVGGRPAVCAV
jgi:hypothetical protein